MPITRQHALFFFFWEILCKKPRAPEVLFIIATSTRRRNINSSTRHRREQNVTRCPHPKDKENYSCKIQKLKEKKEKCRFKKFLAKVSKVTSIWRSLPNQPQKKWIPTCKQPTNRQRQLPNHHRHWQAQRKKEKANSKVS